MRYEMEGTQPLKWITDADSELEAVVKFANRFGKNCTVTKVEKFKEENKEAKVQSIA